MLLTAQIYPFFTLKFYNSLYSSLYQSCVGKSEAIISDVSRLLKSNQTSGGMLAYTQTNHSACSTHPYLAW